MSVGEWRGPTALPTPFNCPEGTNEKLPCEKSTALASEPTGYKSHESSFTAVPYEDMIPDTHNPSIRRASITWFKGHSVRLNEKPSLGIRRNADAAQFFKSHSKPKATDRTSLRLSLPPVPAGGQWAEELIDSLSETNHFPEIQIETQKPTPPVVQEPQGNIHKSAEPSIVASSIYSQDVGSRHTSQPDLPNRFQSFNSSEYAPITEALDVLTPLKPITKDNRTPEQKAYDELKILTPFEDPTEEKHVSAPVGSCDASLNPFLDHPPVEGLVAGPPPELPKRSPARNYRRLSTLEEQRSDPPKRVIKSAEVPATNGLPSPTLSTQTQAPLSPGALLFHQEARLLNEIAENDCVMKTLKRSSVAIGCHQHPEINEYAIAARGKADQRLRMELDDVRNRRRSVQTAQRASTSNQGLRRPLSMFVGNATTQLGNDHTMGASIPRRQSKFHEVGCTPEPTVNKSRSKRFSSVSFDKLKATLKRTSLSILHFVGKESKHARAVAQLDGLASRSSHELYDEDLKQIQRARSLSDVKDASDVMADAINRNHEEKSALFLEGNKERASILGARPRSSSFSRVPQLSVAGEDDRSSHSGFPTRSSAPQARSAALVTPAFEPSQFTSASLQVPQDHIRPRHYSQHFDPHEYRTAPPSPASAQLTPVSILCLPISSPSVSQTQDEVDAEWLGKWASFPKHTKADRIGPAGPRDRVRPRDFASDDIIAAGPRPRFPHRRPTRLSKFGAAIKAYFKHFTIADIEYYKHGHGHRTSVSLGGKAKKPELDLLPGTGGY